jgi:hypothetical protein
MLKRISVNQLTLGMHLKEFCGSYLDHPFWRTGFVLTPEEGFDSHFDQQHQRGLD